MVSIRCDGLVISSEESYLTSGVSAGDGGGGGDRVGGSKGLVEGESGLTGLEELYSLVMVDTGEVGVLLGSGAWRASGGIVAHRGWVKRVWKEVVGGVAGSRFVVEGFGGKCRTAFSIWFEGSARSTSVEMMSCRDFFILCWWYVVWREV